MASTKVIKKITTAPENKIATATKDTPVIEEKDNSQSTDSSTVNNHLQFRAVGIIKGEVKFHDDDKKNPLSREKDFQLCYIPNCSH